ncbi:hypothetical protein ACFW2X_34190 [Streptomyces antibioticus]|uniref:hypothetical protein n=1 Tax=Streptomyces antibioticus TaxID=1890 RepID=UPI0036C0599F
MRNTDPFVWFGEHSDTIFRWLGILGLVVLVWVLLRWWAMRWGGWRDWASRLRREFALTGAAFTAPARSWLRHRTVQRLLVRRLKDPSTWRDAERALAAAALDGDSAGRPYAVLVGADGVRVLLSGRDAPEPWTARRADLPTVAVRGADDRPLIVALGAQRHGIEDMCVFLDLAVGPPLLCVDGDERAGRALLQALAAQLDVRMPRPLVVVAEGVHRGHHGATPRNAYRTARDTAPRLGLAPVLVSAELPDPLPPELAEPPLGAYALRVLVLGRARGYTRRLLADRHGRVAVTGTPLMPRCDGLGRAVVRTLGSLPPVLPPAAAAVAADLVEESEPDEALAPHSTPEPEPGPTTHAGVSASATRPSPSEPAEPRSARPATAPNRTAS